MWPYHPRLSPLGRGLLGVLAVARMRLETKHPQREAARQAGMNAGRGCVLSQKQTQPVEKPLGPTGQGLKCPPSGTSWLAMGIWRGPAPPSGWCHGGVFQQAGSFVRLQAAKQIAASCGGRGGFEVVYRARS